MKKISKLVLLAVASLTLFSCGGGRSSEPSFYLSDLQGLWQDTKDTTHYVRFTNEKSDEPNYLYGREWTEADDVYEEDLYKYVYTEDSVNLGDTTILQRDSMLVPTYGNGWFKYWLETKGDLHEIHLMDNNGAEIPKEYIVTLLTKSRLEYKDKDGYKTYAFEKIVEVQPANQSRRKE
jgi:hypothetical protein